jgi:hypothetical protein
MSDEDLPDISGVTSIFPFIMVLSAVFATGLVFTAINVPLLLQVLRGTPTSSLFQIAAATGDFWRAALPSSPGVGAVVLYGLTLFTIGLAVHPVATVYITLIVRILKWLLHAKHLRTARFYSPPVLFGTDYVRFADWIHRHRVEKIHWEWELFNYYLYAGLAFNILVAAFLVSLLTGRRLAVLLGAGAMVLLSTSYSLARGAVVQQVYAFYSERAGKSASEPADPKREVAPAGTKVDG